MSDTRELRVAFVRIDGLPWVQIAYWRRAKHLLVPSGHGVVVDGRDLGSLITELQRLQKTMAVMGRRA